MFSFANPQYLYLLILLPCVVGLYLLARRARRKRLERMGKRSIIEGLMPETSNSKPVVRLTLQLLLLALVIIILARPQAGVRKTTVTSTGIEAFIALDLSNSMRASSTSNIDDISRLQRSKQVLEKLIDKLNGNKVGLIVFAGRAYMQMPLTTDCMLAKMYLASLDTDLIPTQGTAIGEAIDMAAKSFSDNPKVQKSIIIITDGENFEDDAVAAATQAGKNGIKVHVVGIGSSAPMPIPDKNGGMMTDDAGQEVRTALNEETARAIAKAGNGSYINGEASDAVQAIDDALRKLSKSEIMRITHTAHDEQFPIFAWLALISLIALMLLVDKRNPWLKKLNPFGKKNTAK